VSNPFDDNDGTFLALVNEEGQYSLWPEFAEVSAGWRIAYSGGRKQDALAYIEENWTDMRPMSLAALMDASQVGR